MDEGQEGRRQEELSNRLSEGRGWGGGRKNERMQGKARQGRAGQKRKNWRMGGAEGRATLEIDRCCLRA